MDKATWALGLALLLAGCASYHPLPVADQPSWQSTIPHLQADPAKLGFPTLPPHAFAADGDGLDMTDVAILAVLNNPDLRLARDDAGIAHAQAFSASLLPDPQLSMSADFKREPDPGSSRGYTIGPSYDFGALLSHGALEGAARHEADKADLNLLWQEWQVIAQARVQYVRIVENGRLLQSLQRMSDFLDQRVREVEQALSQGLVTLDVAHTVLASLADVRKQVADAERTRNQARHDFNALLGLAPDMVVPLKPLQPLTDLPLVDAAKVKATLAQLPSRRPDLLALKSGYAAQDERYRAAIIAQFPALSIGVTRARDTSNVSSQGFNVSLSLPVFNRNRGNIAIEQATRQRLHDEYQQRINTAFSDVDRLLHEQEINFNQLMRAREGLRQTDALQAAMMKAFHAGNLDNLAVTNMAVLKLTRQAEEISLEQAMLEQRVALSSVIGGELPLRANERKNHE